MSRNLLRELKSALKHSEWISAPSAKVTTYAVEVFFVWLLSAIAFLLLLPCNLKTLLLNITILLVSVLLVSKLLKPNGNKGAFKKWLTLSLMMFVFAGSCPFIVAKAPLYIAVLPTDNPLASKLLTLTSGGRSIESLLLVPETDVVRRVIATFLNGWAPTTFRLLHNYHYSDGIYYDLPTLEDFVKDTSEPGELRCKRSIYFPLSTGGGGFDMLLNKHEQITLGVETNYGAFTFMFSGSSKVPLLDYGYVQDPATIPWNAVRLPEGDEVQVLKYVAFLDRSFECLATGNTQEALTALEGAGSAIPASNLEAARVATLEYLVTRALLWGNLGRMQCLPKLHAAYDLFLRAQNDPRVSKTDPLTNWLQKILRGGYADLSWSAAFFDRISRLDSVPHLDDDSNSYFDSLDRQVRGKTDVELMALLKTNTYSIAELHFIEYIAYGNFIVRTITGAAATRTENNPIMMNGIKYAVTTNLTAFKAATDTAIPLIRRIDELISRKAELKADAHVLRMLEFWSYEVPRMIKMAGGADDGEKLIHVLKHSEYPQGAALYRLVLLQSDKISEGAIETGQHCEWWEPDYWMWFMYWVEGAVVDIRKQSPPSLAEPPTVNHDTHRLILKYGEDCFTKDLGGNGRTFVPGLFCIAWYAETFKMDERQELKRKFYEITGIPFDIYLSSLYDESK
jgi:hypothetical protein